ncbi:MAG TPA: hypothetical protein VLV81_07420 [Acidimicrobiia bacterium]|nr:hypothetical protein [Acidimicrobiia bacterium]
MGSPRLRFVALVSTLTIVAAACSGGGGGSGASASKRQNRAVNSGGPGCQFVTGSTLTRKVAPRVDRTEYLNGATTQPTVCYDEITFVFDPGDATNLPPNVAPKVFPPSYTVEYKQPPFAPGLNRTAAESLTGVHAILEVILAPASGTDVRRGGSGQTYRGNLRLQLPPGIQHTLIVQLLDTFPQPSPDPNQSVMVWLIGLDAKRPFTTQSGIEPPRISILIPH